MKLKVEIDPVEVLNCKFDSKFYQQDIISSHELKPELMVDEEGITNGILFTLEIRQESKLGLFLIYQAQVKMYLEIEKLQFVIFLQLMEHSQKLCVDEFHQLLLPDKYDALPVFEIDLAEAERIFATFWR